VVFSSIGQLTVNGAITPFEPDPFNSNSKYRWGIRPTVHFDSWLRGEKVSISGDVYYKSAYEVQDETTSIVAGNTFSQLTPWGYSVIDPQAMKSQLLVDLRVDWRNIHDSKVSAAFSVTNLTNLDRLDGVSGGISVAGVVSGHQIDPRFWQFELSYKY
jgi:outer membrane receptor protein involved in Fe transport